MDTTTEATVSMTAAFTNRNPYSDFGGFWAWVFMCIAFSIIGLTNIIGNSSTLIAFSMDEKLRTVSNFYLLNLACTDLMVGVFSIPTYAASTLMNYTWPFGQISCKIWLVMDYFACAESSLTIILISLDRLLMVKLGPGKYYKYVTKKRTVIALVVSWCIAFCIYGPAIIGTDMWRGYSTLEEEECDVEFANSFLYVLVACVLEFCIPLLLVACFSAILYADIRKRSKMNQQHHEKDLHKDRKAARTLFALVIVYLFCWAPYSISVIINSVCECVHYHVEESFTWLLWLNSSLNPFLYAYTNRRIRSHFSRWFCPCRVNPSINGNQSDKTNDKDSIRSLNDVKVNVNQNGSNPASHENVAPSKF